MGFFTSYFITFTWLSALAFGHQSSEQFSTQWKRYPKNCSYLLTRIDRVDDRYGNIFQNHSLLKKKGYFPKDDHGSMLCGPASLVNIAHKFRLVLNKASPFDSQLEELMWLVDAFAPSIGISRKGLIEHGITTSDLKKLAKAYFKEMKMPVTVDISDKKGIRLSDLSQSLEETSAVIVRTVRWPTHLPIEKISMKNREGGHFTVLGGFTLYENHAQTYLIDPGYHRTDSAEKIHLLSPIELPKFIGTRLKFDVEFPGPLLTKQIFVIDTILVELKPH